MLIEPQIFPSVTNEDSLLFEKKKLEFSGDVYKHEAFGKFIIQIAKSYIGTPYAAHTLETPGEECLTVNLRNFDCTTFIESVMALANTIRKNGSYADYLHTLEKLRYRHGKIAGYTSRLHYFSEWISESSDKKFIQDITASLGGEKHNFRLNFMSTHSQLYQHLNGYPEAVEEIRNTENKLSKIGFYTIVKEAVPGIEAQLQDGDIVAFTTSVPGLDIGHVGFVVKGKDNKAYLLHAPQEGSAVQIATENLGKYISHVKKHAGVIILRPIAPEIR